MLPNTCPLVPGKKLMFIYNQQSLEQKLAESRYH